MDWGNTITFLGSTTLKERNVRFGIKDSDRLKHLCVLGRTDTGRAAFLVHMALQDIERGLGTIILDGSGKVTPQLIERVDASLSDQIVHLDPAQAEYPYAWNPLADIRKLPKELRQEALEGVLVSLYEIPRGEFLSYIAELLLSRTDTTLITPHLIITEEKARDVFFGEDEKGKTHFNELLGKDQSIKELFENHGRYIGKDTLIRNLLGQEESKFTLHESLQGKIIVIDFSHIRIFPTRMKPLVRVLVDVARTIAHGATQPAVMYLHDCLRYLGDDEIERMFSSKNIALTIADTVVQEIDKERREFAISRCGSIASFTTHPGDKSVIERAFYPYAEVDELNRLGKDELIMALTIDSVRGRPFFAKVLELPDKKHISYQDIILESRKRYTTPRTEVDASFKKLKGEKDAPKKRGGGFQDAFKNIMENRAQNMPLKDIGVPGKKNEDAPKKEKIEEGDSKEDSPEKKEVEPKSKEAREKKEEKKEKQKEEKSTAEIAEDALRQLLYVAPVSILLFVTLPLSAFASVIISEIMYDLPGSDSGREWIELYNAGPALDIGSWRLLEDGAHHKLSSLGGTVIPQNGYAIIADSSEIFLSEHPSFSGIIFDSVFSLSNVGEEIVLEDQTFTTVDRVSYTSSLGAQGDGMSLSRSGSVFVSGTPTPGSNHTEVVTPPVSAIPSSTVKEVTRGTVTDSGITVTAGGDRESVVGTPLSFEAEAFGFKNEPLMNMRFFWSFGGGELKEGKQTMHTYVTPGTYPVNVVATNGVYTAETNIMVTIFPAPVVPATSASRPQSVLTSAAAEGLVTSPILAVDNHLENSHEKFPPFFGWFFSLLALMGIAIVGVLFVKSGEYHEYSITEIKE